MSQATAALHRAVYRNDIGAVRHLLQCEADVNCVDAETGWTPLHKALYWGHLQVAALLMEQGASTYVCDRRGRTPLELIAEELRSHLQYSAPGGVFGWGSGTNYQLGTASTDKALAPVRLEALQQEPIMALAAAKFHSAALTEAGMLYTWGWGRGGRLGHPDFEGDSTEKIVAQILPRAVEGLAHKHVSGVAAAKHHMLACTADGSVYAWGQNDKGQLGLGSSTATEIIPRHVASLRAVIVAVAAANQHSLALSAHGHVFSWGANGDGQLGYATRGGCFSASPRSVDAIRERRVVAISLAKRHSVVLTHEGEVMTWGHRVCTPTKLQLHNRRDTARSEKALRVLQAATGRASGAAASSRGLPTSHVHFHRDLAAVARPRIVSIAAGASHTSMLTSTGVVLTYQSGDPEFEIQEVVGALAGKCVVKIAAGKTRTVAITDTGEVYAWEADKGVDAAAAKSRGGLEAESRGRSAGADGSSVNGKARGPAAEAPPLPPKPRAAGSAGGGSTGGAAEPAKPKKTWIQPSRVQGIRRAIAVAVGEKHSIALQGLWLPQLPEVLDLLHLTAPQQRQPRSDSSADSGGEIPIHGGPSPPDPLPITPGHVSPGLRFGSEASPSGSFREALATSLAPSSLGSTYLGASPSSTSSLLGTSSVRARLAGGRTPASQPPFEADAPGSALSSASSHHARVRDGQFVGLAVPWGGGPRADEPPHEPADDDMFRMEGDPEPGAPPAGGAAPPPGGRVMRLFDMCQVAVSRLVNLRNVLPIMEWADIAQAHLLKDYCFQVAINNLDAVLMEASSKEVFRAMALDSPHLLAQMEAVYKSRFLPAELLASGAWPSAAPRSVDVGLLRTLEPAAKDGDAPDLRSALPPLSEEELADTGAPALRRLPPDRCVGGAQLFAGRRPTAGCQHVAREASADGGAPLLDKVAAARHALAALALAPQPQGPPQPAAGELDEEKASARLLRTVKKRIQQIVSLEERAAQGLPLDREQHAKLAQMAVFQRAREALEGGQSSRSVQAVLASERGLAAGLAGSPAEGRVKPKKPDRVPSNPSLERNALPDDAAPRSSSALALPSSLLGASSPRASSVGARSAFGCSPADGGASGGGGPPQTPALTTTGFCMAPDATPPTTLARTPTDAARPGRRVARKGGLSLFLSGALDAPPDLDPPLFSTPAVAWGRPDAVESVSMSDILRAAAPASGGSSPPVAAPPPRAPPVRVSSLSRSAPRPPAQGGALPRETARSELKPTLGDFIHVRKPEDPKAPPPSGPAWGGPAPRDAAPAPQPSLSQIILQEQHTIKARAALQRPKPGRDPGNPWARPADASPPGPLAALPDEPAKTRPKRRDGNTSAWYVHEDVPVSSLSAIQDEEGRRAADSAADAATVRRVGTADSAADAAPVRRVRVDDSAAIRRVGAADGAADAATVRRVQAADSAADAATIRRVGTADSAADAATIRRVQAAAAAASALLLAGPLLPATADPSPGGNRRAHRKHESGGHSEEDARRGRGRGLAAPRGRAHGRGRPAVNAALDRPRSASGSQDRGAT